MKNINSLKSERSGLINQARSLIERSEAAGRAMNSAEEREFDALLAQADALEIAIRQEEPSGEHMPLYSGGAGKSRSGFVRGILTRLSEVSDTYLDADDGGDRARVSGWAGIMRNERNGAEIRGYRHNEPMVNIDGSGDAIGALVVERCTGRRALSDEKRSQIVDSDTQGGLLLTNKGAFRIWEPARAKMVVSQLGAITYPLEDREASLLKVTSDPEVAWVPEGGVIPENSATFGSVKLRSRKVAAQVRISVEMMAHTNAQQLISDLLTTAVAQAVDSAALCGSGEGEEPLGVTNTTGILTGAAPGSTLSWDAMLDALEDLYEVNAEPNAYVVGPAVNTKFMKLKDGEGQYQPPFADLATLRKFVTTKMPAQTMIMGDFSQLVLAPFVNRAQIDVVQDIAGARGMYIVQVIAFFDCAVIWPNRLYSMTGIAS